MVPYCWGGHYSSHDSRRRYLSEKSPIFEEIEQTHNSKRRNGHRGSMFGVSLALHQSNIPCSKGEILFRGRSKELRQGEQPQEENGPLPLMSKGEN
jgi:hypothetical protein